VTAARGGGAARGRVATPGPLRLALVGELDIQSAADRKGDILAFLDGVGRASAAEGVGGQADLELDLHGVTDLDTAGLQLLLLARREAGLRGLRLALVDVSPAVAAALALVHLEPVHLEPVHLEIDLASELRTTTRSGS